MEPPILDSNIHGVDYRALLGGSTAFWRCHLIPYGSYILMVDPCFGSQSSGQEYVEWLQFTASAVRDALSLECAYGRRGNGYEGRPESQRPLRASKIADVRVLFGWL